MYKHTHSNSCENNCCCQQQWPPPSTTCNFNALATSCFLVLPRQRPPIFGQQRLWLQARLLRNARPINITFTSASGNKIPTFGSTTRELNLEGQLFSNMLVCAKVKMPIWSGIFSLKVAHLRTILAVFSHRLRQTCSFLLWTTWNSRPATSTKCKLTSVWNISWGIFPRSH